ncbi:hypothetical protein [Wenyingzhuangia sp. IMCC45574]
MYTLTLAKRNYTETVGNPPKINFRQLPDGSYLQNSEAIQLEVLLLPDPDNDLFPNLNSYRLKFFTGCPCDRGDIKIYNFEGFGSSVIQNINSNHTIINIPNLKASNLECHVNLYVQALEIDSDFELTESSIVYYETLDN